MDKRVIAVTGIIGSGKSTVCEILKQLGKAVISADEIYHELLRDKSDCFNELINAFGDEILTDDEIDRNKLSKIVFDNQEQLRTLNSITHKYIFNRITEKINLNNERTVFVEIPLVDNEFLSKFDSILLVKTNERKLIERILKRDNRSESECKKIIEAQLVNQDFESDYQIQNGTDLDGLKREVEKFLKKIEEV